MYTPTVLIVDDEHANQFLLEGLLTANNYKTLVAVSGEDCMKLLLENTPDLILLDIMMPKMTGIEVLENIIKNDHYRTIPVIMVSAKTATSDIEKALSMGAIDYVKKPFDEMELLARVKVGIRLKQNEDRLREMIRQRENFVRTIAHDLRSPFSAIHGFAEILLSDENINEDQKESLALILESIGYSQDYFNKLLDWTRLDQHNIPLDRKDIELSNLITRILQVHENKAADKNIELHNEIDEQITINVDDTYFRQAIANIISNAIKFTPDGGIVVCKTTSNSDSQVLIIADTGIGMPESITPKNLFNTSIVRSRPGTRGEKGTGLGLDICRKIIEAHGFSITFSSVPNKGTEFIVSMPK